jgi:dihydrofolate reductase
MTSPLPELVLVAIVARNGVIGDGHGMPWHVPEDLAHFRRVTHGHPVLMGRHTWDSLPARFRPLPGRRNLVLTRNASWQAEGAEAVATLDEAVARATGAPKLMVIGGAQLYAAALPGASELLLTEIDADFDGQVRFPPWDRSAFVEVSRQVQRAAPPNNFDLAFVSYRKKG